MNASGRTALKAILGIGVVAFILLMLSSLGLQRTLAPNEALRVTVEETYSPFDRARAFEHLRHLAEEIGPRAPGSEGATAARAYVVQQLRRVGLRPVVDEAEEGAASIHVEIPGRMPASLVIAVPLGTPDLPGFAGANLTASASAWLLEMARTLPEASIDRALILVWLDGELSGEVDAAHPHAGSRRFLQRLQSSGEAERLQGVVYLSAIGDCYLNANLRSEDQALAEIVVETAERLAYGPHFTLRAETEAGPWAGLGVPVLSISDSVYGASPLDHQRLWLSAEDTAAHVCPESLQAIADVVYHALPAIEGYLNSAGVGVS